MGCISAFALFFLIAINLVSFIGSGLLLAFGIVAKCNPDEAAKLFECILPESSASELQATGIDVTELVVTNAVFMIIIGVIGLFVAGFGLFGSCCTVRWMLITYIALMVIMLIVEIAPIVFAAVYPTSFKKIMQSNMQKTLFNSFKHEIQVKSGEIVMPAGAVELAWATVQLKEACCGAMNWSDYGQFTWDNNELVSSSIFSGSARVPLSCCLRRSSSTFPPLTLDSFVDISGCLSGKLTAINTQNCYDAIDSFVHNYKSMAIGIAVAIAVIEVILIVTAIVRCENARRTTKYVRFDKK